jgi:hypothetical protein
MATDLPDECKTPVVWCNVPNGGRGCRPDPSISLPAACESREETDRTSWACGWHDQNKDEQWLVEQQKRSSSRNWLANEGWEESDWQRITKCKHWKWRQHKKFDGKFGAHRREVLRFLWEGGSESEELWMINWSCKVTANEGKNKDNENWHYRLIELFWWLLSKNCIPIGRLKTNEEQLNASELRVMSNPSDWLRVVKKELIMLRARGTREIVRRENRYPNVLNWDWEESARVTINWWRWNGSVIDY